MPRWSDGVRTFGPTPFLHFSITPAFPHSFELTETDLGAKTNGTGSDYEDGAGLGGADGHAAAVRSPRRRRGERSGGPAAWVRAGGASAGRAGSRDGSRTA